MRGAVRLHGSSDRRGVHADSGDSAVRRGRNPGVLPPRAREPPAPPPPPPATPPRPTATELIPTHSDGRRRHEMVAGPAGPRGDGRYAGLGADRLSEP